MSYDIRDTKSFAWYLSLDTNRMIATVSADDGETRNVPFTYAVCGVCRGSGETTNPNIDRHGISSEEWARDWDEEERHDYLNGAYNVTCGYCAGSRVEPVTEDIETLAGIREYQNDQAIWQAEIDMESAMLGEY
jgi:hypothetical protein